MTALSAIVGVVSSCSQDDYFSSHSDMIDTNTIAFATNQSTTRSGETITSLDKFTVSAVNADNSVYYSNEEYAFDSDKGVFVSQTPYYWPKTGSMSFYAISSIGAHSVDADNVPMYTYDNWGAEKDLVAATVKLGEKEMPYPLTFRHITSQILVSAEAENKTEALTYKLVSVKMTAPSRGTYSFANLTGGVGSWVIDNTQTSMYSYNELLPVSFKQNGQIELSSTYWNILPITDGTLVFDVEYQVYQNGKLVSDYTGSHAKKCEVEAPGLVSGMRYIYNFILPVGTSDEITFTAEVRDWKDADRRDEVATSRVNSLTLSSTFVKLGVGSPYQLKVVEVDPSDATKIVTWESSNKNVVSVDEEGNLNVKDYGTVTITATTIDKSKVTATCKVKVIGDYEPLEAVDLDLPSGTLWANMNVGSVNRADYGMYFAWGETTGYYEDTDHLFTKDNYTMTDWHEDLVLSQDAAYMNLGSSWRMPTKEELEELLTNTDHESARINGIYGVYLHSKIDAEKKVFFPHCGYFNNLVGNDYWGSAGAYWSATHDSAKDNAYLIMFRNSGNHEVYPAYGYSRECGYCVRAVAR